MNVPTANAPSAASVAQTAPVAASNEGGSPGEASTTAGRIAAIKARFAEESPSTEVAEDTGGDTEARTTTTPVEPSTPEAEAAAKARADRQARIEAVRAKESAAEQARARENQSRAKDGEVEQLRKRLSELEPLESVWKDPAALLEAAEKRGLTATQLIQEMRTRLTDPEAVAKRQVQSEADKLRAEMDALRAETKAERERWEAERKAEHAQQESVQKAHAFVDLVTEGSAAHPHTARLLRTKGANGLITFANEQIVPHLAEGYTVGHLHDQIEKYLEWILGGDQPAQPAPAANAAKKNGAAKPVTTLSDSLTSERHTVAEEVPLHRLPKKERVGLLRAKLERE